jgi:hypothetical protein
MPVAVVADDDNNNGHIKREPGVIDIDNARWCGLEWWWQKKQTVDTNKQTETREPVQKPVGPVAKGKGQMRGESRRNRSTKFANEK